MQRDSGSGRASGRASGSGSGSHGSHNDLIVGLG